MKKLLVLIAATLLCSCSAVTAPQHVEIEKPEATLQVCSQPQVEEASKDDLYSKFRKLGEFYRRVYLSELVFDAMVDVEKLKRSIKLRQKLLSNGIISSCQRALKLEPREDKDNAEKVLRFKASEYECKINDLEKFYEAILQDEFISYFKLKKKTGSYWLYMDLTPLATWERYFWYAYFIEKGFEPEFSERLQIFVLGHFNSAQDALQIKNMHPEANLKVKFAVYQSALTDDSETKEPIIQSEDGSFVLERIVK